MSENPYQVYFDKLDRAVADLEDDAVKPNREEIADLLRRAGFVLANLLNVNARVLPHLILTPGEPETPDSEDAATT